MIITMTWCKGLNERCKGHNEWCKGLNEWCKGLWWVQGPHHLPFYLITNDNQYRGSLHCSLAPCYLWERGKRARYQRAMDLFSYMKILGKPIKKQVNINQCKYVCMKLVRTCWENWQYALTHKAGPLVPMLNVCTMIGTSSLLFGTLLHMRKGTRSKVFWYITQGWLVWLCSHLNFSVVTSLIDMCIHNLEKEIFTIAYWSNRYPKRRASIALWHPLLALKVPRSNEDSLCIDHH